MNAKDEYDLNGCKALIFDLDGTLLYTLEDIARAVNISLSRYGYPGHETEDYRKKVGWGLFETVKRSMPTDRRDAVYVEPVLQALIEEYRKNPVVHTAPYDGIETVLDILEEKGLPKCILSNKEDSLTGRIVTEVLAKWSFFKVQGSRDDVPKKPHPSAALAMAASLGIDVSKILFVGDSAVDVETAKRAGMCSIGVLWGYKDREEIEAAGPACIVSSPQELGKILRKVDGAAAQ